MLTHWMEKDFQVKTFTEKCHRNIPKSNFFGNNFHVFSQLLFWECEEVEDPCDVAFAKCTKGITRALINLLPHSTIADNGTLLTERQMASPQGCSSQAPHCLGPGFLMPGPFMLLLLQCHQRTLRWKKKKALSVLFEETYIANFKIS